MYAVATTIYVLLLVFLLLLVFRIVMEYVFLFARQFRPSGLVAVALEITYTITDPPLKALRRVIPPLRLGSVQLDLGFLVLFFVVQILMSVVNGYRR